MRAVMLLFQEKNTARDDTSCRGERNFSAQHYWGEHIKIVGILDVVSDLF
jgi:hypothetical protein